MASSFWERRENIKQRPSVELRTERVIHHCMEKYGIGIGQAIEKIMRENLYNQLIEELTEVYPDIVEAS